jgi:hypothetical protein
MFKMAGMDIPQYLGSNLADPQESQQVQVMQVIEETTDNTETKDTINESA